MVSASGGFRSPTTCQAPKRMVADWIFGSQVQFSNYVQDRRRKVAQQILGVACRLDETKRRPSIQ